MDYIIFCEIKKPIISHTHTHAPTCDNRQINNRLINNHSFHLIIFKCGYATNWIRSTP